MTKEYKRDDDTTNERSSKQTVEAIKESTKQQGRKYLDQGKGIAAEVILDFADALKSASGELKEKDRATSAEYMRAVSGTMRDFSSSLKSQSPDDLVKQVRTVVRRQPALLLGGAALVGFAVTRFLKAADRDEDDADGADTNMHPNESRTTVPPGTRTSSPDNSPVHPEEKQSPSQPVASPADNTGLV